MRYSRLPRLAYIDGGLAAFIAQAAVAGFLGALLILKGYWYRIKAFFSGAPTTVPAEPDKNDTRS